MPSFRRKTFTLADGTTVRGICENIHATGAIASAVVILDPEKVEGVMVQATILDCTDSEQIGETVEAKILALESCYRDFPIAILKGNRFQNKLTHNPKTGHYDRKTLRCDKLRIEPKENMSKGLTGRCSAATVESLEDFSAQVEIGDGLRFPVRYLLFAKGEVWSVLYDVSEVSE
ncbi:MAG: hypothetical protein VX730_03390 [Pseudomonadota bacterium]|nr:hypothetical protein [Pseudomonadota bacterium]